MPTHNHDLGENPKAVTNTPQLYTAGQAAEPLQIPTSWLRKKATARAVPCTFIGKHLRFSTHDLEMIIKTGAHTPTTSTNNHPQTNTTHRLDHPAPRERS